MPAQIRSNVLDHPAPKSAHERRPPWRRRLVDVERGFASGLRGDGAFFVHFFSTCIVITASIVLGISLVEWAVVTLSLTLVLSAEMFRQVLKSVLEKVGHFFDDSARTALRIGSAAVFVAILGATLAVGLIFARAIAEIFRGT